MNNITRGFYPVFSSTLEELERFFDDSIKNFKTQYPMNVIKCAESGYRIDVALAGFSKEDISIEVNKNVLNISASIPNRVIKDYDETSANTYIRRGISYREMNQSFQIGENIDVSNITVDFVNGLLSVNLPLRKEFETLNRKIEISW